MYNRIISMSNLVLIFAIATLFLLNPAKSYADAISVSPPLETTVQTGSERTFSISIIGAQDLGALQFELSFNKDIVEIVDVARGSGIPPVLLDFDIISQGLLRVALAGSEPIDGDAVIDLRVRGLAEGSGAIELMDVQAWALSTGFELLTKSTPGMVTVSKGLPFRGILIAAVILLLLIALIALFLQIRKKKTLVRPNQITVPQQYDKKAQTPSAIKRFCPQCGQQLTMNAAFCGQCGTKI
jgi:hypothetical protein